MLRRKTGIESANEENNYEKEKYCEQACKEITHPK